MVEVAQGEIWWVFVASATRLDKDSVANAFQIISIDRSFLTERVARLGPKQFAQILHGIDLVLGR